MTTAMGGFLYRLLQIVGLAALLVCLQLAWGASPLGGEGWARGRLLYAGAGAVSALALVAIGGLGLAAMRARRRQEEMAAALSRLEQALAEMGARLPPMPSLSQPAKRDQQQPTTMPTPAPPRTPRD